MKVIDTHVHFWDPTKLSYAWLNGVPRIAGAHLPEDYQKASTGIDIVGKVFVEAGGAADQALQEVDWVDGLAERDLSIRAIVAQAAMERGAAIRSHLAALKERPLVKGVRRLIQSEAAGFAKQASFIDGVRMLPDFGFTFDLCLKHHQLNDVIALVKACPETSFVLDHIAKPAIVKDEQDPWREDLEKLGELPNVIGCKLSGIITEADHDAWTPEQLRPYIAHAIDVFGHDRILYGSDWPVSVLAGGYQRWWETLTAFTHAWDEDAKRKLYHDNAAKVYRLV